MQKVSILIVDDRPENLLSLESLLESSDFEIIRAGSGHEALSRTLDHDFALVLMDVHMPGMDGYETAELMRGNKKTKQIPIIFVTAAQKRREQIFKGYELGAVDYLFKPLEPLVLKSKVGVLVELYRQRIQLEGKNRELDGLVAELEELQQELRASNARLLYLSSVDGLTGLANRRAFDELLVKEWTRGIRDRKPLSVIIADIDHFKAYNDFYGHVAGDQCLKQVAKTLADSVQRDIDIVARYGGEEFVAILPATDSTGLELVAKRMMDTLASMAFEHKASPVCGHVTISLGGCTRIPESDCDASHLVEAADKALYEAKKNGRNRFHAYCSLMTGR